MKHLFIFITYITISYLGATLGFMPNQAKAQSAIDFKAKMDSVKQKTLLDVRMPREYGVGHIKGAINYNIYDKDFKEKVSTLDKKTPVFVYCKGGSRSTMAIKQLKELGFIEVHELKGGILEWEKERLEVVKEKVPNP